MGGHLSTPGHKKNNMLSVKLTFEGAKYDIELPVDATFAHVLESLVPRLPGPPPPQPPLSASALRVSFRGRFRDPLAPLQSSGVKNGAPLLLMYSPEWLASSGLVADVAGIPSTSAPTAPPPPPPPPPLTPAERLVQMGEYVEQTARPCLGDLRGKAGPLTSKEVFEAKSVKEELIRMMLEMDGMDGLTGSVRENRKKNVTEMDNVCDQMDQELHRLGVN